MRTKPTTWCDTKNLRPVFGIKVRVDGKWLNVMDNSGPLFFDTEAERDAKRKELSALRNTNHYALPLKSGGRLVLTMGFLGKGSDD